MSTNQANPVKAFCVKTYVSKHFDTKQGKADLNRKPSMTKDQNGRWYSTWRNPAMPQAFLAALSK